MKSRHGFTLLELMVVIAIIAITSAITIPNLIGWLPNYRLGSASRDVLSALQHARLQAVKENTWISVAFNTGTNNYTAFVDDGAGSGTAGNGVRDGSEILVRQGSVPAGVSIKTAAFDTNSYVSFTPRGYVSNSGGITLENSKNKTRNVDVSFSGNIVIN